MRVKIHGKRRLHAWGVAVLAMTLAPPSFASDACPQTRWADKGTTPTLIGAGAGAGAGATVGFLAAIVVASGEGKTDKGTRLFWGVWAGSAAAGAAAGGGIGAGIGSIRYLVACRGEKNGVALEDQPPPFTSRRTTYHPFFGADGTFGLQLTRAFE